MRHRRKALRPVPRSREAMGPWSLPHEGVEEITARNSDLQSGLDPESCLSAGLHQGCSEEQMK